MKYISCMLALAALMGAVSAGYLGGSGWSSPAVYSSPSYGGWNGGYHGGYGGYSGLGGYSGIGGYNGYSGHGGYNGYSGLGGYNGYSGLGGWRAGRAGWGARGW